MKGRDRAFDRAFAKYREFYQLEPRDVEPLYSSSIPEHAYLLGEGAHVLYRSDKLNPTTGKDEGVIDYIHEHEGGVMIYGLDPNMGPERSVPRWIHGDGDQVLVALGRCPGFAFHDDGEVVEVKLAMNRHRLCALPSGKALVVLDGGKPVALIWGGSLGVEARGIVG
jgi:hypothetical protein